LTQRRRHQPRPHADARGEGSGRREGCSPPPIRTWRRRPSRRRP
jgi:hypothetical protein